MSCRSYVPNPRARTRRTLALLGLPCILPVRAVCSRGSFAGWGVVPGLGRAGLVFFFGLPSHTQARNPTLMLADAVEAR